MDNTPCVHSCRFTVSQLLGDHVKVVVFSCSEYEARNYGMSTSAPKYTITHFHEGRFLLNILKDLWAWQQSEELYLQDNRAKGTKKAVFHPGMQKKWSMKPNLTQEDILSWTEFKIVLKKWQRKLGKVSQCFSVFFSHLIS